jgi:hypothetical protein
MKLAFCPRRIRLRGHGGDGFGSLGQRPASGGGPFRGGDVGDATWACGKARAQRMHGHGGGPRNGGRLGVRRWAVSGQARQRTGAQLKDASLARRRCSWSFKGEKKPTKKLRAVLYGQKKGCVSLGYFRARVRVRAFSSPPPNRCFPSPPFSFRAPSR